MRLAWIGLGVLVMSWLPLLVARSDASGDKPLGLVLLAMCGTVAAGVVLLVHRLRNERKRQWWRE